MKKINNKHFQIVAFIKAIDKTYFDRFIDNGEICLNPAKWFREYERNDANIGDAYEGARVACGSGITLCYADPIKSYNSEEDLKNKISSAKWSDPISGITNFKAFDSESNGNILSLYAVESFISGKIEEHILPRKFVDEFSNCRFIMIVNPMAFISKIEEAMRKRGKSLKYSMVRYYNLNEKLNDNLSLFDKQDKYAYQNEFRLVSKDPNAKKQILNVGSLRDICFEIYPTQKMYRITNDEVNLIIRMENKQ